MLQGTNTGSRVKLQAPKPAPKPTIVIPPPSRPTPLPPPVKSVPQNPPPPLTVLPAAVLAAAGITQAQYAAAAKAGDAAAAAANVIVAGGTAQQAAAAAAAAGAPPSTVAAIQTLGDGDFVDPSGDPNAFDGWEFEPFLEDMRNLESANASPKILRGMAFVDSVNKHCEELNVDRIAAYANALAEGIGGGIGDQGTAYGPWQMHATDGRIPAFKTTATYLPHVQAWAWTDNGIDYAIRSMVAGGAAGLRGHAAVHDIVYGFEKPGNIAYQYTVRAHNYDFLLAKGNGLNAYIASIANGPSLTSTPAGGAYIPSDQPPVKPVSDKPTVSAWKDLTSFMARDVPYAASHTQRLSSGLIDIFKKG